MPRWQLWVAAAASTVGSLLLGSAAPATTPPGESIALTSWRGADRGHRPPTFSIRASTTGKLYPGVRRKVTLTISNPNPFAIKVRSIRGTLQSTSKPGCRPRPVNLAVRPYQGRLPMTVGAGSRRDGTALEIYMPNSVVDACQGAKFVIHVDVDADASRADR